MEATLSTEEFVNMYHLTRHLEHKYGDRMSFGNVGAHLPKYTISNPKRSYTPKTGAAGYSETLISIELHGATS